MIDVGVALHHGEFAAVSALMEHHGIPIDMKNFPHLADEAIWRTVRDAMVPAIDARYRVYVRDSAGNWTFNMERFLAYLEREGITGWPRLESGKLDMEQETFKDMCKVYPQLEELRQLRHHATKCAQWSLRLALTVEIVLCSGRSRPRHHAHNQKPLNGSSRQRCGCDH